MKIQVYMIAIILAAVEVATAQATLFAPSAAHPTIQAAIIAAQNGDVVEVLPGTYSENLIVDGKIIEIRAQQRGTVTIDGGGSASCLVVQRGADLVLDGFVLSNGQGTAQPIGYTNQTFGGGIWVRSFDYASPSNSLPSTLLARFCKITGNQATSGGAMYVDLLCTFALEDSEVSSNSGTTVAGIWGVYGVSNAGRIERCIIRNNGTTPAYGGVLVNGGLVMVDTVIEDVSGPAVSCGSGTIDRCQILGCQGVLSGITSGYPTAYWVRDTLIARCGTPNATGSIIGLHASASFTGCTIVDTIGPASLPTILAIDKCQFTIENSILRGNAGPDFGTLVQSPWPLNGPPPGVFASYCCLSAPDNSGPGNIVADPQFVDASSDDYRLLPGSPCVDAGDQTLPNVSQKDLSGGARVVLGDVDIGCFEGREMAHHPASRGRVGENLGGPYEILEVDGQTGDAFRIVRVPIGTSSTVTMLQAPVGTVGAKFVIFGVLGAASVESVVNVPLGIGDMMFAPQPMVPAFLHWLFFTYTNNFDGAVPQLVVSTPTPWSSGPGPAIPFPLTVTFQAVLEESPGVFVPTNAVTYKVE